MQLADYESRDLIAASLAGLGRVVEALGDRCWRSSPIVVQLVVPSYKRPGVNAVHLGRWIGRG